MSRKMRQAIINYSTLENGIVYSSDLKWIKQGSQEERLKGIEPRPVHDDIVLAKLRPGQHISLECHAVRGTGKEHAKFSPVCTAHYRMMPEVKIVKDIFDDKARKLLKLMPGVFELEKVNWLQSGPTQLQFGWLTNAIWLQF